MDPEQDAADRIAPTEGNIEVLALTTSASAEQDLGSSAIGRFVTFICSARFYITFGTVGAVTDPDDTATSGGGRTWEVPADTEFHVRIVGPHMQAFKAKGASAANLRRYVSSPGQV